MESVYDETYVQDFDRREWSRGSERNLFGNLYRRRLKAAHGAVRRLPAGSRVADLGCAQGNLALVLASEGFCVTGVERNAAFLRYARSKDRMNSVTWVCSEIGEFRPDATIDAAILTEVLEHTGCPERLIDSVDRIVRPGGWIVITTPNGERIRQRLPTFARWVAEHDNRELDFGPAGEHHQYLFTRQELRALLAPRFSEIAFRPIASIVYNRWSAPLLQWSVGRALLRMLEGLMMCIPAVGPKIANEWLVTARQRATSAA
jgi:2-polyprenyl-3-methyl-5-hydroxy-6-metoxy-1,4-benzoquinol methylase